MNYQLIGDATQTLLVNMQPGESVRSEPGNLLFCNDAIDFDARSHGGLAGGVQTAATGGALAAGAAGGHSVAYTEFACSAPDGTVALAAPYPGKIHPLELGAASWLCQRDSLLCVSQGVVVESFLARKMGAGLFGGEGFVLLRLSGTGTAWVHLGGDMVQTQVQPGHPVRIDPASLGCCTAGLAVDLRFQGGFRNALFGGEGSYLAELSGEGNALLQTVPLARLAGRIAAASGNNAPAAAGAFGRIGNVFGD